MWFWWTSSDFPLPKLRTHAFLICLQTQSPGQHVFLHAIRAQALERMCFFCFSLLPSPGPPAFLHGVRPHALHRTCFCMASWPQALERMCFYVFLGFHALRRMCFYVRLRFQGLDPKGFFYGFLRVVLNGAAGFIVNNTCPRAVPFKCGCLVFLHIF